MGRILVFGGGALIAGLVCTAWLDEHRERGLPAILQAKTIVITAGRAARVAESFIAAGQTVAAGDRLLRLADDKLAARLAAKQREIAQLEAEQRRVEAAAEVELQWRQRELQADAFATQLKAAACLQERVNRQVQQIAWKEQLTGLQTWIGDASAEATLDPLVLPARLPNVARVQALLEEDAAASAAELLETQLKLCEQRLKEIADLRAQLEEKVRISAGVDVVHTRLAQTRQELAALQEQEQALTIVSPGCGTVGVLSRQPGDLLAPGDAAVELLDEQQRYLQADVPTELLGRYAEGAKVRLLFAGREVRSGVVRRVPPQTTSPQAEADREPTVRIQIEPTGRLWPNVPFGSRVIIEQVRS